MSGNLTENLVVVHFLSSTPRIHLPRLASIHLLGLLLHLKQHSMNTGLVYFFRFTKLKKALILKKTVRAIQNQNALGQSLFGNQVFQRGHTEKFIFCTEVIYNKKERQLNTFKNTKPLSGL